MGFQTLLANDGGNAKGRDGKATKTGRWLVLALSGAFMVACGKGHAARAATSQLFQAAHDGRP